MFLTGEKGWKGVYRGDAIIILQTYYMTSLDIKIGYYADMIMILGIVMYLRVLNTSLAAAIQDPLLNTD